MHSVEYSVLGKRCAVEDWRQGLSVKKGKANCGQATPSPCVRSSSVCDSDEECSVREALVPSSDDVPFATAVTLDDPFIALESASAVSSNVSDFADLSEGLSPKKRKRAAMDSIELLKLPDHLQDNTLTSTPKKRRTRSSSASLQTSVLLDVQSDAYDSQDKSSKKRQRRSLRRSRSREAFADFDTLEEPEVVQSSGKYPFVLSGSSLTPFRR